jgi:TP901 family phage tail tape measure protein
VTSREAIYGYLAQYVGKDEFTEFQRNPASFGLGKLSQMGVVKKANPKEAEALVRGMLKSIEQQSQSLAEQYTNIMAVATAGQQKGFEHFINASKNMYARKASGATQAEMTGEGAAGLITQQIKSQVSAHAAMTDLLGIDPGSGIKSVLTRYKEASTLLGSTKEGDESAFVRSLQDRVFTPSPVFGNNLFPRPTAGEKSEHANEKQVSEGKPSKKMVFSNYRFTDRDEHILNAAEAAADEAKIHDEQQRSEFQFSAVLADSIRQGLKSGKINPAARSKNSAKNYLTGEGFQRLLGTYQELGGTEDPEVLKKTIGAKANELADFIHSKSTGPGDSAASLGIRNTLQRIEENTRALKGMGHAGGGSVPALRDRTIEGHLDEAFGLPSFDKRDNFAGRFRNALGRVAIYGGGASLLYGGIGAVRGGFESAMNIDAARTQLRMVQNPLDNNSGRLIEQAKGLGEKYGVGADQIGQAMATFQREGNNTKEMLSNVDTALMATNVTEMTLLETTQALTAAEKQFGFTAQQSKQILDGWLNVQDSTAVSARTLSDALKISATSARAAGLDFHTLNGVIGAVGESTRESGERIGTSVKYIFQQMHRPKSVDALQQLGVTTEDAFGNMKSGVNVMGELASRWDKLTDAQKQNVAISIAGTEHLNDFFVMMENWDRAIDLSVSSLTSQGSAVRKNELAMESAHKKVDQLRVSLQNLWHSIIDAGALDFLKQMTDSLRGMVDLVGKVNHGSGGVLGGLAGSLGVAGAGVGAASWLTGGFLPEVLGGGFAPRGISEDMRRQRGGGGDSAASLGGVGSGTYFTPRRFGSLGLLVGSSFLQGTYNNYYRQAAPGQAPTGRDFAVDAGTSALQGAGMIGMFAKSGGLQQQGVGRMLLMSLIAAQTAGSIYSKYKTYSSGTTPGTADEAMGRYENLRAMEDKYSQGRSTLLQYVRDFKAGRNGEGMDPAKLQDMADMVAALQPGLVKFNEAGQITIKDVEGWADALTTASKRLRNERVEVLKAATAADLKSPETQKLLRQRQDLLAQRSGYGENTPLADRLGNQAAISANVEQLRGKFYNPMLAQSILAGQASGAISPFGRDDITGIRQQDRHVPRAVPDRGASPRCSGIHRAAGRRGPTASGGSEEPVRRQLLPEVQGRCRLRLVQRSGRSGGRQRGRGVLQEQLRPEGIRLEVPAGHRHRPGRPAFQAAAVVDDVAGPPVQPQRPVDRRFGVPEPQPPIDRLQPDPRHGRGVAGATPHRPHAQPHRDRGCPRDLRADRQARQPHVAGRDEAVDRPGLCGLGQQRHDRPGRSGQRPEGTAATERPVPVHGRGLGPPPDRYRRQGQRLAGQPGRGRHRPQSPVPGPRRSVQYRGGLAVEELRDAGKPATQRREPQRRRQGEGRPDREADVQPGPRPGELQHRRREREGQPEPRRPDRTLHAVRPRHGRDARRPVQRTGQRRRRPQRRGVPPSAGDLRGDEAPAVEHRDDRPAAGGPEEVPGGHGVRRDDDAGFAGDDAQGGREHLVRSRSDAERVDEPAPQRAGVRTGTASRRLHDRTDDRPV